MMSKVFGANMVSDLGKVDQHRWSFDVFGHDQISTVVCNCYGFCCLRTVQSRPSFPLCSNSMGKAFDLDRVQPLLLVICGKQYDSQGGRVLI